MSARRKYKILILQGKMEVLNKLEHGASIQGVISQYGVSKSILYDIKKSLANIGICAKTG
jgi:hypothetical protein